MLAHVLHDRALEVSAVALAVRQRAYAAMDAIGGNPTSQQAEINAQALGYLSKAISAFKIGADGCELEALCVLAHNSPKGWISVQLLGAVQSVGAGASM